MTCRRGPAGSVSTCHGPASSPSWSSRSPSGAASSVPSRRARSRRRGRGRTSQWPACGPWGRSSRTPSTASERKASSGRAWPRSASSRRASKPRTSYPGRQAAFGPNLQAVPLTALWDVSREEVMAGKLLAFLDRVGARDLYDVAAFAAAPAGYDRSVLRRLVVASHPGRRAPRVLLEGRGDECLVRIQGAGPDLGPGVDAAIAIERAADGLMVDPQGVGHGADRPVLGVEEAAHLGALEERDHRRPSAPRRGPGRAHVRQGDVAEEAARPAAAGTPGSRAMSRAWAVGIEGGLLGPRRRDGRGGGRGDDAAIERGLGSLMRHILAPGPIAGLAGRVVESPPPGLLVPPGRRVERGVPRMLRTGAGAVAIAAIAPAAEEEDPTAVCAPADDESERVHAPPRARRGGGQSQPDMRRQGRAESRAPARFGPRARSGSDSGPSPTSALGGTALPQVRLSRKPQDFSSRPLSRIPHFPVLSDIPFRSPGGGRSDARRCAPWPAPRRPARAGLCRGPERRVRGTLCGGQGGAAPRPGGGACAAQD